MLPRTAQTLDRLAENHNLAIIYIAPTRTREARRRAEKITGRVHSIDHDRGLITIDLEATEGTRVERVTRRLSSISHVAARAVPA